LPRLKKVAVEDRRTVTVTYTIQPYFQATTDDPMLKGISGVGHTARRAVTNLRSEVRRRYPYAQYDLIEKTTDKQLVLATSWKEPTYD